MSRWYVAKTREAATRLVLEGATPVGGSTALLSEAFPSTRLEGAGVLVRWPLAPASGVVDARETLDVLARRTEVGEAVRAAAAAAATPAVRSRATIGGWLALRVPGLDILAPLVVQRAQIIAISALGTPITIPVSDYLSEGGTRLLTEVWLPDHDQPSSYRRTGWSGDRGPLRVGVAAVRRSGGGLRLALAGQSCPPPVLDIDAFPTNSAELAEIAGLLAPAPNDLRRVAGLLRGICHDLA
jgi:hypothetical protein